MRRTLGFVAMALVVSASTALGEPGPAVTTLINEPVSLMSFGLDRLNDFLTDRYSPSAARPSHVFAAPLSGPATYSPLVYYNWDENSIILTFFPGAYRPADWDFEAECKQLFAFVRHEAGIDPATGRVLVGLPHSLFATYFTPIGYANAPLDEAASKIDGIINLVFNAQDASNFICIAPLLDSGDAVRH